jgi:hypothetical protein
MTQAVIGVFACRYDTDCRAADGPRTRLEGVNIHWRAVPRQRNPGAFPLELYRIFSHTRTHGHAFRGRKTHMPICSVSFLVSGLPTWPGQKKNAHPDPV